MWTFNQKKSLSLLLIKPVSDPHSILRLNVGFIVHQTIGYSREFDFNTPKIPLDPDFELRDMHGAARISRTPQGLLAQVKMSAVTQIACVRCLEEFSLPLQVDFSELYAFDRRYVTDSGLILPETGYINLSPVLRDFMLLELPISPICRPDCKGLCLECGGNLNEQDCGHRESPTDPRLNTLRSLLE